MFHFQVLLTWSQSATSPADVSFAKHILGQFFGGVFMNGPNEDFKNGASQPATMQEQVYALNLNIIFLLF